MAKKSKPWKTLSSLEIYKNPWIRVREDQVIKPDGSRGIYGVVEVKSGIFIVAINDKFEVCLINLFRYTTNNFSWELPGGGIDLDNSLENAKKELGEETGIIANNWHLAGKFHSLNGVVDDLNFTFIAKDLSFIRKNEQIEEGINEMKFISFPKIFTMIREGKLTDSQSITALTQAAVYLQII